MRHTPPGRIWGRPSPMAYGCQGGIACSDCAIWHWTIDPLCNKKCYAMVIYCTHRPLEYVQAYWVILYWYGWYMDEKLEDGRTGSSLSRDKEVPYHVNISMKRENESHSFWYRRREIIIVSPWTYIMEDVGFYTNRVLVHVFGPWCCGWEQRAVVKRIQSKRKGCTGSRDTGKIRQERLFLEWWVIDLLLLFAVW